MHAMVRQGRGAALPVMVAAVGPRHPMPTIGVLPAATAMPLVPPTLQLPPHVPLYVDLDGTLVQTDTLHELVLLLLKRNPFYLLALLWWCLGGKAHLKRQVSDRVVLDAGTLPWHAACLAWVRQELDKTFIPLRKDRKSREGGPIPVPPKYKSSDFLKA